MSGMSVREGEEREEKSVRETVLLINFKNKKKLREMQMLLMAVKLRMRLVKKEEYLQPIGFLAGRKDIEPVDAAYTGDELEKEMMVFADLTDEHLNQVLYLMRKGGAGPVDYKAILTESNKSWTVPELYEELAREHEAIQRQRQEMK